MLSTLAISNYRSLRDLVIRLQRLNVVTGPNGSGKSNLYRALRLLADIAQGRIIPSLAREGGIRSTLWAGPHYWSIVAGLSSEIETRMAIGPLSPSTWLRLIA
jgi:predicted ATPase